MAATKSASCGEENFKCSFGECYCESGQEKIRLDAENNSNGQSMPKGYTIPDGYPLPKTSRPPSQTAKEDKQASGGTANEQFESKTSTINILTIVQAISLVCSVPVHHVSRMAAKLDRHGKPVNNENLIDECDLYVKAHGPCALDYPEGDKYMEINGASGVSVSNASTLTTDFQSSPSSGHVSEHSSLYSKYHYQFNSTARKSLSSFSDNSNSNNRQSNSYSCEQSLVSLPITNQDHHFSDSIQSGVNNAGADVGEDSTDGHNFESSDGLDSWLGNGLSSPFVHVPDRNLEYTGSSMLPQTVSESGHNMLVNKPGQNMLFNELSNEKTSVASLNTSKEVSRVQQNYVSGSYEVTPAGSPIDRLSRGLSTGDNRKPVSTDIVCDGVDNEIIGETIHPQKLRGVESTPDRKCSSLSRVELIQTSISLLEKEREILETSRLCHSCHEKSREITFLPCGHFITCAVCAEPIYTCPLCQKSVLATVNTYLC